MFTHYNIGNARALDKAAKRLREGRSPARYTPGTPKMRAVRHEVLIKMLREGHDVKEIARVLRVTCHWVRKLIRRDVPKEQVAQFKADLQARAAELVRVRDFKPEYTVRGVEGVSNLHDMSYMAAPVESGWVPTNVGVVLMAATGGTYTKGIQFYTPEPGPSEVGVPLQRCREQVVASAGHGYGGRSRQSYIP